MAGMIATPATVIVAGSASGEAVVTDTPLSLWGGLDPDTAEVIDRHHPLLGRRLAGKVLVMPSGRGSCTASGVLLETIRQGVAPAAIVLVRVDPIIGLGAILGEELYRAIVPVVVLEEADFTAIRDGQWIEIADDGALRVGTLE